MNTHELFCIPMSVSHHERLAIMTDVQENHLTDRPDEPNALFSAADVAILPPGTGYAKRRSKLLQSRTLLRQMKGCVQVVQTKEGERFLHSQSPLREGLHICNGCVFHEGTSRGTIPLPCPENLLARKITAKIKPSIEAVPDDDLRQLTLPSEF